MSNLNKIQIGKKVVPLIDKFFIEHEKLINYGLTSFSLFFRKNLQYTDSIDVFNEFCFFETEINKRTVGLGSYFSKELERFEKEALKKFEVTGDHYDRQYPEYKKIVIRLSDEDWNINVKHRECLIAALKLEREEEFKRKKLIFYQKYETSIRKQYKKLATDVFLNNLSNIGFILNKKKGGKDYIICEKAINETYSLFLSLSLKYLKSNESDSSTKKHQFFFQFGLVQKDETLDLVVNNNPKIATWQMRHFFPIDFFPYWGMRSG